MPSVSTCLWFDHQALEAAEFYTALVPGSAVLEVVRDPGGNPHTQEGAVLFVQFRLGDQRFGAVNGGPTFRLDEAVSVVLDCDDQDEADAFWDGIVEAGGTPSMCGWITDPYGLSWQVVPREIRALQGAPEPDRARRSVEAMMLMRRLDSELMRAVATGPDGHDLPTGQGACFAVREQPRREYIEGAAWYPAPPEQVWAVVAEPGWFVADTALGRQGAPQRPGAALTEIGSRAGEYVTHRWESSAESGPATTVAVWLTAHEGGTFLTVVESFFLDAGMQAATKTSTGADTGGDPGADTADAALDARYEASLEGWRMALDGLGARLGPA